MPLFKDKNALFIHIPKTGGTSISNMFGLDLDKRAEIIKQDLRKEFLIDGCQCVIPGDERHIRQIIDHMTPSELIQFGLLKENDFKKYFKFCFVRNPWDKIISAYFFGGSEHFKHSNFKEWLLYVKKIVDEEEQNGFTLILDKKCNLHIECLYRPQYFYTHYNNEIVMDFIGKFENYEEDVKKVFDTLNLPIDTILHKKKSIHKHYSTYYDDETIKIVADIYSKDIELFGYSFNNQYIKR